MSCCSQVIDFEMSHDDEKGSIHKSIAQVQAAIDGGGTWKQFTAIVLLRLTPVVSELALAQSHVRHACEYCSLRTLHVGPVTRCRTVAAVTLRSRSTACL